MEIQIRRKSGLYHCESTNEAGNIVTTDGSVTIGGTGKGMTPMQLLLVALGNCSAIDVVLILEKQKQDLKDIQITVNGERAKDQVPSLFTDIQVHFKLFGKIDAKKAERAINLSMDKYCSVGQILKATATISHSYEILEV